VQQKRYDSQFIRSFEHRRRLRPTDAFIDTQRDMTFFMRRLNSLEGKYLVTNRVHGFKILREPSAFIYTLSSACLLLGYSKNERLELDSVVLRVQVSKFKNFVATLIMSGNRTPHFVQFSS